jgi:hypothetical protein
MVSPRSLRDSIKTSILVAQIQRHSGFRRPAAGLVNAARQAGLRLARFLSMHLVMLGTSGDELAAQPHCVRLASLLLHRRSLRGGRNRRAGQGPSQA